MTNIHPFGKPDEVRKADNTADTPNQKRFEAATGKDSASPTGDVDKKDTDKDGATDKNSQANTRTEAPSGVDKGAWEAAEAAVLNKNGGFSGISKEGRIAQVQEQYDQIEAINKQARAWEGKEEEK